MGLYKTPDPFMSPARSLLIIILCKTAVPFPPHWAGKNTVDVDYSICVPKLSGLLLDVPRAITQNPSSALSCELSKAVWEKTETNGAMRHRSSSTLIMASFHNTVVYSCAADVIWNGKKKQRRGVDGEVRGCLCWFGETGEWSCVWPGFGHRWLGLYLANTHKGCVFVCLRSWHMCWCLTLKNN